MNLTSATLVSSTIDIYYNPKTKRKFPCKYIDKYALLREIGRGSFATVFEGN